jgi:hypothetical protein
MLKKGRRRKDDSSAASVASSGSRAEESTGSGEGRMRSSIDGVVDTFRRRSSVDTDIQTESQSRRLSKLKNKLRRKRDDDEGGALSLEQSTASLPAISIYDNEKANASDSSLLHKSIASSLLTEDSEHER